MRIRKITARGFKRFTDLTIKGLPETARLVVLVGPNGCGKSSLFDAMNHFARRQYVEIPVWEGTYLFKGPPSRRGKSHVEFHGERTISSWRTAFQMRSAYRHVPTLDARASPRIDEQQHAGNRMPRLTSHDEEIKFNFHRLYNQAIDALFEGGNTTAQEIIDSLTLPAKGLLERVMPGLRLNSLEHPQSGASTFYFAKGKEERYSYDNLSGGERAAFDLILDMIVKRGMFPESVYCIDEPESHIGMGVQGELLRILFDLVPENSQLWIATHSIGMLRKASEIASSTGEVVFLDFSEKNFDQSVTIEPTQPDRQFWRKMHKVALEDMAALVAPDTIIICESQKGFDAKCYNRIFSSEYPQVQFASVGGKGILPFVRLALKGAEIGAELLTLKDRDGNTMTPDEIEEYRKNGERVLSRQCIEEYLLDDEVLQSLCEKHKCPEGFAALKDIRDKANNPKAPFADIRHKLLELSKDARQVGESLDAFKEQTLAPLIRPGTKVYRQLKADIFGAE